MAVVSPEVLFRLKAEFRGQSELDKAITSTQKLQKGFDNVGRAAQRQARVANDNTKATNRNRMAFNQIGFQINDFSTQMQNGAKFSTAFSQQIGQLGFAMSMLGGKAGVLGAVLGGIGGTVLSLAVMFGSQLFSSMKSSSAQAEELAEGLSQIKFATDAASRAQSILASVMDTTTGKIKEADAATIALARSKLLVLRAESRVRAEQTRQMLEAVAERKKESDVIAVAVPMGGVVETALTIKPTEAALAAQLALSGATAEAQAAFEKLAESSKENTVEMLEFSAAVANLGLETKNINTVTEALESLSEQKPFISTPEAAQGTRTTTRELTEFEKRLDGISKAVTTINRLFESGLITEAQYTQALANQLASRNRLNEENKKGIDILNEYAATVERAAKEERDLMAERFTALVEMNDMIKAKQIEALKSRGAEAREEAKNLEQSFVAIGTTISGIFRGLITGAQSFGDAIKSVIGTVIDELFRLFVVQQIVGFVSGALQGAIGGSGKVAGATKTGGLVGGGGAGGNIMGGKMGSGGIMSAGMISGKGGIGGATAGMVINVDARGSTDPAAVKAQVEKGILEAAPSIIAAAQSKTVNSLRRPRLAGVL